MIEEILSLKSSWEVFSDTDKPMFIYGTGNGADAVLDEFSRLGIAVKGVFASDEFVRKRLFRGFEVKSLSQVEAEYDDFSIAVCFASSIPEVVANIKNIADKHFTLVPVVPVYGKEIFNRKFVIENAHSIEMAYSLLADEESRRMFILSCKFMFTGDMDYLFRMDSSKDEVFNSFFQLSQNEKYLDCGAYRGDTVYEFLKYCNGAYSSITAVEPDKKTFAKLAENTKNLENITLVNKCISDFDGYISFSGGGGRQSAVNTVGEKTACTCIDSLAESSAFTYIKADVEGMERELLSGGGNFIFKAKPKLNIAAYHRSADIFSLPILINRINPDYKIYLRKHPYIPCWDLNLYCI